MKDIILRFRDAIIGLRVDIGNGRDSGEMFNEVRRLYRHVKTCLADLLTLDEEKDLREALSQIDNFFLVEMQSDPYVKQKSDNGELRACIELMREIQEAIRNYFNPRNDSVELFLDELTKYHIPEDDFLRYLSPENINILLNELPTIKATDLKRNWFVKYKLSMVMKGTEFFDLCESVVHRKGERGWSYENFKKA